MLVGGRGSLALDFVQLELALLAVALMLIGNQIMRERTLPAAAARLPWWVNSFVLAAMMVLVVLGSGENRVFLYFQF